MPPKLDISEEVHTDKVWTWPEVEAWERQFVRVGKDVFPDGPPPYWPKNVELNMGRWAQWLPDGFAMGTKILENHTAIVYVDREGKIHKSKDSVQQAVIQSGGTMPEIPPEPHPTNWPDWLPTSWGRSRMKQNNKNIFIQPKDGEHFRFFRSKPEVEDVLNGGTRKGQQIFLQPETVQAMRKAMDSADSAASQTQASPPAKRLKREHDAESVDKCTTSDSNSAWPAAEVDAEVQALESPQDAADCYCLQPCSASKAWVVLPADVECISLRDIGAQIRASGWKCTGGNAQRFTFSGDISWNRSADFPGKVDIALYADGGKLLIRTSEQAIAADIAERYSGHSASWLATEDTKSEGSA